MIAFLLGVVTGLLLAVVLGRAVSRIGKVFAPQEIKSATDKTPADIVARALGAGCLAAAVVVIVVLAVLAAGA